MRFLSVVTENCVASPKLPINLYQCVREPYELNDAIKVGANLITYLLGGAGLVAVVFIILGGIQYAMSSGEPQRIAKAKDTIVNAVVGLLICMGAFFIVNFVAAKVF
jgi:hypothetical protein